jgi:hypothetical protein
MISMVLSHRVSQETLLIVTRMGLKFHGSTPIFWLPKILHTGIVPAPPQDVTYHWSLEYYWKCFVTPIWLIKTLDHVVWQQCWMCYTHEGSLQINPTFRSFQHMYLYTSINIVQILFLLPVELRPNAGHGLLVFEVTRSHTTTHHSL